MKYKFNYKRKFFWRSVEVVGHSLERSQDGTYNSNRMVLYYENGGIEVLPNWSQCSLRLGVDWVLAQKEAMEKEAGGPVKLNVKV